MTSSVSGARAIPRSPGIEASWRTHARPKGSHLDAERRSRNPPRHLRRRSRRISPLAPDVVARLPRHATLITSEPAEGDTLLAAPARIRLRFSEPIEDAFSAIVLLGADGVPVALSPRRDPADVYALVATVPPIEPGAYRLAWRITSADGHPVHGSYVFYVAAETAAGLAVPGSSPPAPAAAVAALHQAGQGDAGAWVDRIAPVVRGLAMAALLGLAGVLLIGIWLGPSVTTRTGRLALGLAVAAPILLAADVLVWMLYTGGSLSGAVIREAAGTGTGRVGLARAGVALLALWALGIARRPALAGLFAMVGVLVGAALGHAAANQPFWSIPLKAAHLVAVAAWLGGLLILLSAVRSPDDLAIAGKRVSGVALAAVVAIAITGVAQTIVLLPEPADLIRSRYGWLVLGKAAGLMVLVLFGARHRYRLLPDAARGGLGALRRSVAWETVVLAAVILLAGFLAYTPLPAETPAATGPSPQVHTHDPSMMESHE